MKGKRIQKLTAGLCLLILLVGLVRTLVSPVTEIAYENRPANRRPALTLSAFLTGAYQEDMEAAAADQIPNAARMKKLYNIFDTGLALPLIHTLAQDGGYVGFRDIYFYEDMLVVRPVSLAEKGDALRESARRISAWASACPDVDFYVYYIETDRDMNLQTGIKTGLYDCFSEALELPTDHVSKLSVDRFDDYRQLFFKTDHHWNADGSLEGYREICTLLGITPMPLLGQYGVPACYRGTRAAGVEGVPAEDFAVNLFPYPDMQVSIPYGPIPDYGMQEQFVSGELDSVSYGKVFGVDCGELVLDTGRPGENLLVMGDSYDNAVVKPLAAGFSCCRCVDLRSYASECGVPFVMEDYVKEHDISLVLFVGGIDYFGATLALAEGG